MEILDFIPAAVVGVAALFAGNVIARYRAQPIRIKAAMIGKQLLARDDVPESVREYVEFWLDHAFGITPHLVLSLFVMPIVAPVMALNPRFKRVSAQLGGASKETRKLFAEFEVQSTKVVLANNGLLLLALALEVAVSISIVWILTRPLSPFAAKRANSRVANERESERLVQVAVESVGELPRLLRGGWSHAHA